MKSKRQRRHIDVESDCPIPGTHRRLADAHRHWHQTLKEYANPDGFRINLNATIQELRNITFILQKEKRSIPNFDSWYATHQQRLKESAVLRWAVEARNKVVKQGDLATRSKATLSLVASYLEVFPTLTKEVSHFTREGEKIVLAPPREQSTTTGVNIFEPIREVWRQRRG